MAKFRKLREHSGPKEDADPVSVVLREVTNLINRRRYQDALAALDALVRHGVTDPVRLSQIASLAADSQFALARYADAITLYGRAFAYLAEEKRIRTWIRPALGEVRALLKAIETDTAYQRAIEIWQRAATSDGELEEELATTADQLAEQGPLHIAPRPIRPSVVLTRLGNLFLEEGYMDIARYFYQQAVLISPRGATRARQGMAIVCLAATEDAEAEKYAREAIQMGKFQAKTVCCWETLIAARAKQGKNLLDTELFTSLQINQSGPVLARAMLAIVKALRGYGDLRWKQITEEWITHPEIVDEIIEVEMAKILLSDEKLIGHDSRLIALSAHRIFRSSQVSPKEMVATAKDVTHMLLLGSDEPNVRGLAEKARRRFGDDLVGEVLHAIALGAMMARRHDLAREILHQQLALLPRGSKQWAMDLSALARMEVVLKNHQAAASHYLDFADTAEIQTDFRVQALLKWLENAKAAGGEIDTASVGEKLDRIVSGDLDLVVLLNIGRHLSYVSGFEPLRDQVIAAAESKGLKLFEEATTPEEAIGVLIRLTRKQHWDFQRFEAITGFWEGLSETKREWLWSEKSEYWEYYSLVFEAYLARGQQDDALHIVAGIVNATNTPPNGLVWLGTAYANWRMQQRDHAEAFRHYEWLVKELPTHPVASWGYYWQAVRALADGNQALAKEKAAALRRCFAGRPDFLWQWQLDSRALMIITGYPSSGDALPPSGGLYTGEYLERQIAGLKASISKF
jgi:tetratricopeptide (TPR) repeat protein